MATAKMSPAEVEQVAAFVMGVEELSANTGVRIDFYTTMPVMIGGVRTGLCIGDQDSKEGVAYYVAIYEE